MTEGEIIALGAELAARRGSVTTAINVLITTAHNGRRGDGGGARGHGLGLGLVGVGEK